MYSAQQTANKNNRRGVAVCGLADYTLDSKVRVQARIGDPVINWGDRCGAAF